MNENIGHKRYYGLYDVDIDILYWVAGNMPEKHVSPHAIRRMSFCTLPYMFVYFES